MIRSALVLAHVIAALAGCSASDRPAPHDAAAKDNRGLLADGGIDCDDYLNTPTQTVVRACVYEIPADASAAQGLSAGREAVTVRVANMVVASYGACPCDLPSIELIPAGAKPETYQPPAGLIRASDYDQSCNKDADCIETFEGTIQSGQCHCPNAAINQKASDRYQADFYAKRPTGFFLYQCDCSCFGTPSCLAGVCTLRACSATTPSSYIDAGG